MNLGFESALKSTCKMSSQTKRGRRLLNGICQSRLKGNWTDKSVALLPTSFIGFKVVHSVTEMSIIKERVADTAV